MRLAAAAVYGITCITHEKMLNIANYQRNANQNYDEILPHTSQNGYRKKTLQIINAREGVERKEPF